MGNTLEHLRYNKSLCELVSQECKELEMLLHDDKLHDWDEDKAAEIVYLLQLRNNSDVNVYLARRWLERVCLTNKYASRAFEQWETEKNSVYDTYSAESVLEILIFRMLTWQRSCCLIVKAWKAAFDDIPVDTVCQRLLMDMLTTISWEEKAADGAHAYEW